MDDPDAPAGFAIFESEPSLATSRPMYRVYEGCNVVRETLSRDEAIRNVAAYLSDYLPGQVLPGGILQLAACAVVGETYAAIGPWSLPYQVPQLPRRLHRQDLRLLEGGSVFVDTGTNELVVPGLRVLTPGQTLPRTTASIGAWAEGEHAGRWRVRRWVLRSPPHAATTATRAEAVARGMALAYRWGGPVGNLRLLARWVDHVEPMLIAAAEEAVDALIDATTFQA